MFKQLQATAEDPILGLFERYQADARPHKVNLGIGLYTDAAGRLPVLDSVRAVRDALGHRAMAPSGYLPTEGDAALRRAACELVFGDADPAFITTVQTLAGTGALALGADFLRRSLGRREIWVSDPTWGNHAPIFEGSGLAVRHYPYYDPATGGLNFAGMLAALRGLAAGSVVLLQPCCHNPTGVDPSPAQWQQVLDVVAERELLPFFDMAYQGFGRGMQEDAEAVRACVRRGLPCLVASSYSKIFSLYGERIGTLSIHAPDGHPHDVLGQLKNLVRGRYTCPPAFGAALVAGVLGDAALKRQWQGELEAMRLRMRGVREALHAHLARAAPAADWRYLLAQQGMFSHSGLSPAQVQLLREAHAVYVVPSGRLCVAGIHGGNLAQVGQALAEAAHAG